jgi:hypothetical protein
MRTGLSALKGVLFLVGVMSLTGAKTNGCGPDLSDGDGEGGSEPIECPEGFFFDGQMCVPDDGCPPGSEEQWVCAGGDPRRPQPARRRVLLARVHRRGAADLSRGDHRADRLRRARAGR